MLWGFRRNHDQPAPMRDEVVVSGYWFTEVELRCRGEILSATPWSSPFETDRGFCAYPVSLGWSLRVASRNARVCVDLWSIRSGLVVLYDTAALKEGVGFRVFSYTSTSNVDAVRRSCRAPVVLL